MYIFNYPYISKARQTVLFCISLVMSLCCSCSKAEPQYSIIYDKYVVTSGDMASREDSRWAEYLISQMNRRAKGEEIALRKKPATGRYAQITIHIDKSARQDYSAVRKDNIIQLTTRDNEKMLWLVYQFLGNLSTDQVDITDLLPPVISMENSQGDFAFEYRGIYSPSNTDAEMMPITASHNVDFDWGLWGHNLHRVFQGEIPTEAQAWANGKRNKEQFCFSSETLYKELENFIIDNYGEGGKAEETSRFTVMPNDNRIACTCEDCTAAGNTATSATPAVSRLLARIARRFPHHLFFTTSYMTTSRPTATALPENAGVIISAIDVPMRPDFAGKKQTTEFSSLVKQWGKVTKRLYIWDYIRNFDDYLTPYPCLSIIKKRLQYFRSLGVKGIFYNGSGYDYSSFDDLQTATITALLVNPDIETEPFIKRYMKRFYPVSHDILSPAYLSWEEKTNSRNADLPFYGGISDAVKAWLDPADFFSFFDKLEAKSKSAAEEERHKLNKLLTALHFTRLELQRMPNGKFDKNIIEASLRTLGEHTAFKDMENYRESDGSIDRYIKDWRMLISENAKSNNPLKGTTLSVEPESEETDSGTSLLTDGRYALPTDYHTGWKIFTSKQFIIKIPARTTSGKATISLSFLNAPVWRINLPEAIEIRQNGKLLYKTGSPKAGDTEPFSKHTYNCELKDIKAEQPVEIHIKQKDIHRNTVACDEIRIL